MVMKGENTDQGNRAIQVMNEIVARAMLASQMGQQYQGSRDIYTALGYKKTLSYADYEQQYKRHDIAKAIIDRPVKGTWRGGIVLSKQDSEEDNDELKSKWEELEKSHGISANLRRVDRLASLGEFAVLLLGLSDVRTSADNINPVQGVPTLVYVKPIAQKNVTVSKWEEDPTNPRYGMPDIYSISVPSAGVKSSQMMSVHHSRIIHVVEDSFDNDVYGIPRLQAVYNRLDDLQKLVGASAEMYWRGARPGYTGKVDPDYNLPSSTKEKIKENIEEYEHDLRRVLINEGVEMKSLTQQIADPKGHVDVQLQMISAVTNIPRRLLTGSEQGELASSEDSDNWSDHLQERREGYAEPNIVRKFVDRLMQFGALPKVDKYTVKWRDLYAKGDKELAEIGKERAAAYSEFMKAPGVLPVESFFRYLAGLPKDVADELINSLDASIEEEEAFLRENPELDTEKEMD